MISIPNKFKIITEIVLSIENLQILEAYSNIKNLLLYIILIT
jgi:hypothetical protein